jgi:hypothetical protein
MTHPDHLAVADLYRMAQTAGADFGRRLQVGPQAMRLIREQLAEMTGIPAEGLTRVMLLSLPVTDDDTIPPYGWQIERDYDGAIISAGRFTVHDPECRVVTG